MNVVETPPAPVASPGARPARRVPGWSTAFVLAVLFVVGALVPVLIAEHYGALEIPRSDDWSYLLTLFRWVDDGTLDFNGWVSMTLIGQLALAAPVVWVVGDSISAVHVSSAVVSFLGLAATYWLARRLVPPLAAAVVALSVAAIPFWGALATTYMSDNWAFSVQMLALALAAVAFGRRPLARSWLVASVGVGFLAVAIRQYAAIPVVAVLLVAWIDVLRRGDRRGVRTVALLTGMFVAATAVLLVWWSGIPDSKTFEPATPDFKLFRDVVRFDVGYFRLTGLVLVPVVLFAGPVRILRRAWAANRVLTIVVVALIGGYAAVQFARLPNVAFVNNYLAREGVLAQDALAGTRPEVMHPLVFDGMVWAGIVSIVLVVLAAVPWLVSLPARARAREWWPVDPMTAVLALSSAGFLLAYSLAGLVRLPVFDRYALPVFPLVALLVLRTVRPSEPTEPSGEDHRRGRSLLAFAAIGVLGAIGLGYTVESASFDATKWSVATEVVRQGYSPLQVDGGFEWVAWHREQGPPWRIVAGKAAKRRIRRAFNRPFCVQLGIGEDPLTGLPLRRGPVIASGETVGLYRAGEPIVARRFRNECVPGEPEPLRGLGLP